MYFQSTNDFPETEHLALFAPLQNDKSPFKCVTIFTAYIVYRFMISLRSNIND